MTTPSTPAPEPVLNTYLAVQLQPREASIVAVEAVCVTAKMLKILFRRIEVLDIIQVGMRPFVRLRSDMTTEQARVILAELCKATNRGVVACGPDGKFEVQFPPAIHGGKRAPFASLQMHTVPRGPQRLYRGPKIARWELQFKH